MRLKLCSLLFTLTNFCFGETVEMTNKDSGKSATVEISSVKNGQVYCTKNNKNFSVSLNSLTPESVQAVNAALLKINANKVVLPVASPVKPPSFNAEIFGIKLKKERVCFILDSSLSTKVNNLDKLLRDELSQVIGNFEKGRKYSLMFTSAGVWQQGDVVTSEKNNDIYAFSNKLKNGKSLTWNSENGVSGWKLRGTRPPEMNWFKSSQKEISDSIEALEKHSLVRGDQWSNAFNYALDMSPLPEEIIFLTDGITQPSANKELKTIAKKAKEMKVKIHTISGKKLREIDKQTLLFLSEETKGESVYLIDDDVKDLKYFK